MSGSGEMAVRRFEKGVRSGDGECEGTSEEGHGLASALDRDSMVGNTCNMKSRISPCKTTDTTNSCMMIHRHCTLNTIVINYN
jgi:hypothetical protein